MAGGTSCGMLQTMHVLMGNNKCSLMFTKIIFFGVHMGMSENGVYPQNDHSHGDNVPLISWN